jgi:hypothetical protein
MAKTVTGTTRLQRPETPTEIACFRRFYEKKYDNSGTVYFSDVWVNSSRYGSKHETKYPDRHQVLQGWDNTRAAALEFMTEIGTGNVISVCDTCQNNGEVIVYYRRSLN